MTTDPTALAREVLMRDEEADAINDRVGYDASSSLYVENGWSAPALARAVIELTAELDAYREENTRHREKIARMEALADRLDHEAEARRAARQDPFEVMTIRQEAARIRTALNGDSA